MYERLHPLIEYQFRQKGATKQSTENALFVKFPIITIKKERILSNYSKIFFTNILISFN